MASDAFSPAVAAAILLGIMLVAVLLRQPIGPALFLAGLVTLLLFKPTGFSTLLSTVGTHAYNSTFSWVLLSLPMFIFMGNVMLETGISKRMFNGLSPLFSHLPGGLNNVNMAFAAVFGAISGSTASGVSTLTAVVGSEFEKRPQYRMSQVYGAVAGGSTLATTIPPSVMMIIYAALVQESVGALFMAGILPGILAVGSGVVYVIIESLRRREGRLEPSLPPLVAAKAIFQAWPAAVLIGLTLVTIYMGVATASEAAALGCLGAVLIGLAYRELTWKKLMHAAQQSVVTAGMLTLAMIGAMFFSQVSSFLFLPQKILDFLVTAGLSPWAFVAAVTVFGLVLGMFGMGSLMLLIAAPIVYPVLMQIGAPYGWDGIWFGIYLVLLMDLGNITPPVGMSVFIIAAMTKRSNDYIFKGVMPYVWIICALLVLIAVFPQIVTWLPTKML